MSGEALRRAAIRMRNGTWRASSGWFGTEERLASADWLERLADALDAGIVDPNYCGYGKHGVFVVLK